MLVGAGVGVRKGKTGVPSPKAQAAEETRATESGSAASAAASATPSTMGAGSIPVPSAVWCRVPKPTAALARRAAYACASTSAGSGSAWSEASDPIPDIPSMPGEESEVSQESERMSEVTCRVSTITKSDSAVAGAASLDKMSVSRAYGRVFNKNIEDVAGEHAGLC